MKAEYLTLLVLVALAGGTGFTNLGSAFRAAIDSGANGDAARASLGTPTETPSRNAAAPRGPGPSAQAGLASTLARLTGIAEDSAADLARIQSAVERLPAAVRDEQMAVGQFVHAHSGNGPKGVLARDGAFAPAADEVAELFARARASELPAEKLIAERAMINQAFYGHDWSHSRRVLFKSWGKRIRVTSRRQPRSLSRMVLQVSEATFAGDRRAFGRVAAELEELLGADLYARELADPKSVSRQLLRYATVRDRGWQGILLAPGTTQKHTALALERFFPDAPAAAREDFAGWLSPETGFAERFRSPRRQWSGEEIAAADARVGQALSALRDGDATAYAHATLTRYPDGAPSRALSVAELPERLRVWASVTDEDAPSRVIRGAMEENLDFLLRANNQLESRVDDVLSLWGRAQADDAALRQVRAAAADLGLDLRAAIDASMLSKRDALRLVDRYRAIEDDLARASDVEGGEFTRLESSARARSAGEPEIFPWLTADAAPWPKAEVLTWRDLGVYPAEVSVFRKPHGDGEAGASVSRIRRVHERAALGDGEVDAARRSIERTRATDPELAAQATEILGATVWAGTEPRWTLAATTDASSVPARKLVAEALRDYAAGNDDAKAVRVANEILKSLDSKKP
jgi:hypothetical protein